jgi:hypothetical protein
MDGWEGFYLERENVFGLHIPSSEKREWKSL